MKYIRETFCVHCQKCEADYEELSFFTCSGCDMVFYCSQTCQEANRPNHQKYCVKVEFYFKMLENFREDELDSRPELKCRMLVNLGKSAFSLAQSTCSLFTLDIAKDYLDRAWKYMIKIDFFIPSFPSCTYISIMHSNVNHFAQGHCESFDAFIAAIKNCPLNSPQRSLSGNIFPLQRIKKYVISLEIEALKQKEKDFREFMTSRSAMRYKTIPFDPYIFLMMPIYIPMMMLQY